GRGRAFGCGQRYARLVLAIVNSSNKNLRVSTKPGQFHTVYEGSSLCGCRQQLTRTSDFPEFVTSSVNLPQNHRFEFQGPVRKLRVRRSGVAPHRLAPSIVSWPSGSPSRSAPPAHRCAATDLDGDTLGQELGIGAINDAFGLLFVKSAGLSRARSGSE